VQLKTLLDEEQRRNTEILAVAPQGKEGLLQMIDRVAEEDGVPPDFPFLADADLRVIKRYGLYNPDGAGNGRYEVPHPATFVIDKAGIVRWRSVDVEYSVRPSSADLLAALESLH
jgi:peroxiredoxin